MIRLACERIRNTVITYIHHQVQIFPAYGLTQYAFCLAGSEARHARVDEIGILLITGKSDVIPVIIGTFMAPFYEMIIYFFPKLLTACE